MDQLGETEDSFRNLCACGGNCVCTQISCGLANGTVECCLHVVFPQTVFFKCFCSVHTGTPTFFPFLSDVFDQRLSCNCWERPPSAKCLCPQKLFLKDLTQKIPPLSHSPGNPRRDPDSAELSALAFTQQCHPCALKAQGKAPTSFRTRSAAQVFVFCSSSVSCAPLGGGCESSWWSSSSLKLSSVPGML